MESKRQIAEYLVHVHILALQLFKCEEDHYTERSAAGERLYSSLSEKERDMADKLDEERKTYNEECPWQDDGEYVRPGIFSVEVPMKSVRTLARPDVDLILGSSRPNIFYNYFLLAQRRLFELSQKAAMELSDHTTDRKCSFRFDQDVVGIKCIHQLRLEASDNMQQLVCVLKTLKSLRGCIGKAEESSHLTGDELQKLKIKLAAFDKNSQYSKATRLVSDSMEYEPCLVNSGLDRWW